MGSCRIIISNHFQIKLENEEPNRLINYLNKVHILSWFVSTLSIVSSLMLFPLRPIEDLEKKVAFNTVYIGNTYVGNRIPCKAYVKVFKNKTFMYKNLTDLYS